MVYEFEIKCVNHEDNGGDDKGVLGIDYQEGDGLTFLNIVDVNEGESVAASVFLTLESVGKLSAHLNTILERKCTFWDYVTHERCILRKGHEGWHNLANGTAYAIGYDPDNPD